MHIPRHPEDREKHAYLNHHQRWLTVFSIISFAGVLISSIRFFGSSPLLYPLYPFLAFTVLYYAISLIVQGFGREFDASSHFSLVKNWAPETYPSVDIFLPVCGEDVRVIRNTWEGVRNIERVYKGKVTTYCLDDGDSAEVKALAEEFGFNYLVRSNRGHFKKAGNLRHGFNNSDGEFIVIFDADFRPRSDFLTELLPYFYADPTLGIVQSPQYFDVRKGQNWLERGAGAVQEYFYRSSQQTRQKHGGAICVGSNAIYRREALATNGGSTLIEHSEDVHTGFDLRRNGWDLLYVPLVLAKGVCPNDLPAFFRQQYRWCMGSMSLLSSKKFWETPIPFRSRLCYISGFLYYIHTAVFIIIAPLIPLALLFVVPEQALIVNYLLLIPSLLYTYLIFPLWHKSKYGIEVSSVKIVYGWAHLLAIADLLRNSKMEWHPSGSKSKKQSRYTTFIILLVSWNMTLALLWVSGAVWHMVNWNVLNFLPVFLNGLIYFFVISRILASAFAKIVTGVFADKQSVALTLVLK